MTSGVEVERDVAHLPFSILERIDDVVTTNTLSYGAGYVIAFSILERIDDVVTDSDDDEGAARAYFQYPRTDRRCCD